MRVFPGVNLGSPVDCMEKSVRRMPHPWFPFNNINSEMAMEASANVVP